MKQADICATFKQKKRRTTNSNHAFPLASNILNRQFAATDKDQFGVTDTTYLWTKEGFVYLAAVEDLYSRKVVGWMRRKNHDRALILSNFQQVCQKRVLQKGLLHHLDRWSQYASFDYLENCFFIR